ncbi:MAG TPA: FAD-binding oxidoreductase [archaeon]|nr:FAD-binding oxidoreductase [archaeon]
MQQKMKIAKVTKETHDTVTLSLKGAEQIPFKPGQFIMIELLRQEKIPKRAYSISSSPTRTNFLEITIKEMPDGWISKILNTVKDGEELNVSGPFGHFVFDEEKMPEIVMLAAGSGIAPFRCFCQYVQDKKLSTKIIFAYANKTTGDIIFEKQLKEFAKKLKNMELILTLSREEKAGYRSGRIDEQLIGEIVAKKKNAYYFICGPPKMVEATKAMLIQNGIEKEKVKVEVFG